MYRPQPSSKKRLFVTETIIENYQPIKMDCESPVPTDTSAPQFQNLKFGDHCGRGWKDCENQRVREFAGV